MSGETPGHSPPAWLVLPGNSDTAVVAFSARGVGSDEFHLSRVAQHFPELTTVLVRDRSNSWYNAGLPDIGDSVEQIAARITRKLSGLGVKRTLTLGSSMGGYAAILFGCMMGAERVVSFSPQTLLDSDLRWMVPSADVVLQAPDLKPVIEAAPQTNVDVLCSSTNILDVFHVHRIASLATVRVLESPYQGHSLVRQMNADGELWPVIERIFDGGIPTFCEVVPPFPAPVVEELTEAAFSHGREEWREAVRASLPLVERWPEWTAPHSALGHALGNVPEWSSAEIDAVSVVRGHAGWARPRARLIELLQKQGRNDALEIVE